MAIERSESDHREELGVELYGIQQELARLQACLEGRHETNAQAAAQRRQAQDQLEGVRSQYRTTASQAGKQRSHGETHKDTQLVCLFSFCAETTH
jgi:hypothetical protein